jgi:hypothetical protein
LNVRTLRHTYWPLGLILPATFATWLLSGWLAAAITMPVAMAAVYALFLAWWKTGRRRCGHFISLGKAAYLNVLAAMLLPWRVAFCDCCFGIVDTKFDPCAESADG